MQCQVGLRYQRKQQWKNFESVDTSPPPKKVIADISKDVVSSNGKKTYLVLYRNSQWTCNCVGYGFRRKCKHIDKIKNETNN